MVGEITTQASGNGLKIFAQNTLEDISMKLAEKWKPGVKKKDNGVLIVIFKKDSNSKSEYKSKKEHDVIKDITEDEGINSSTPQKWDLF